MTILSPAPASTFPGPVSAGRAGSVDGAAGRDRRSAAAPTSKSNRLGTRNPEAAEGATAIAQKQV
jgi:hypothetical protein